MQWVLRPPSRGREREEWNPSGLARQSRGGLLCCLSGLVRGEEACPPPRGGPHPGQAWAGREQYEFTEAPGPCGRENHLQLESRDSSSHEAS